jgi:hypothetical protein
LRAEGVAVEAEVGYRLVNAAASPRTFAMISDGVRPAQRPEARQEATTPVT